MVCLGGRRDQVRVSKLHKTWRTHIELGSMGLMMNLIRQLKFNKVTLGILSFQEIIVNQIVSLLPAMRT